MGQWIIKPNPKPKKMGWQHKNNWWIVLAKPCQLGIGGVFEESRGAFHAFFLLLLQTLRPRLFARK